MPPEGACARLLPVGVGGSSAAYAGPGRASLTDRPLVYPCRLPWRGDKPTPTASRLRGWPSPWGARPGSWKPPSLAADPPPHVAVPPASRRLSRSGSPEYVDLRAPHRRQLASVPCVSRLNSIRSVFANQAHQSTRHPRDHGIPPNGSALSACASAVCVVLRTGQLSNASAGATMSRLKCLLGRHDWHSEYDHEAQRGTWSCRRCGVIRARATGPSARSTFFGLGGGG
jgi:hypothetical protein